MTDSREQVACFTVWLLSVVAALLIGALVSHFSTIREERDRWERATIERGYGEYRQGKWQWKGESK